MNLFQSQKSEIRSVNNSSFLRRFYIYQKERFPFLTHGLLIGVFNFSAISYSRICRGSSGFINYKIFLFGVFISITLFFLVRIFDEFKDAEDDKLYRKELPVPRGLITLKELGWLAGIIIFMEICINLIYLPKMAIIFGSILLYLFLMSKEFFISDWLKKNPIFYVGSHMFIIPLMDIYASGLDWNLLGFKPPIGLFYFFGVSYMNGIVLEIGRKIRIPEEESEGVQTYSYMLGANRAIFLWIFFLAITLILSIMAGSYIGYGLISLITLLIIFFICVSPAVFFLIKKSKFLSKTIEISSGIWTIAMYLTLGAIPMISKLIYK